jgi:N-acetylmuramoyl-L-alanine amidase
VDTLVVAQDQDTIQATWVYLLDFFQQEGRMTNSPGPDPSTFSLTLEGNPEPFHLTGRGRFVHWFLADPDLELPAVLELRGRNLAGRATPVRRTVLLPGPARRMNLKLVSETAADDEGFTAVSWRVPGHSPLPPGTLLFRSGTDSGQDLAIRTESGFEGNALLPHTRGLAGEVEFKPDPPWTSSVTCHVSVTELPPPWRWRQLVNTGAVQVSAWSCRTGLPVGVPAGMADQRVPLVPYQPGRPVWVTAPGFLPLVDPDPANPDTARTVAAVGRSWTTEPLVPALSGKIIVLDPAGGGTANDGTGPLGTRGATVNLETALLAKKLLEGCGAVVHLTREGEQALPDPEKVRLAGEVHADFFLTLGRSPSPHVLTASHHPGSETGRRWAELFLSGLAPLATVDDSLAVSPSYNYLLRHTACPALEVRLPGLHGGQQEMLLSQRGWQRAEARAVLHSLVSLSVNEGTSVPTLDVAVIIAELPGGPDPAEVDWAELDGNFTWSPVPGWEEAGPRKGFQDPGLPALLGRHTLEIRTRVLQQLWLLERTATGYSARLMIQNPRGDRESNRQ